MRYLKPALVGLAGGLALVAAVLTVEFIHSELCGIQITICVDVTAGGGACSGSAQVGGVGVPIGFAPGFAAGIIWFRRRQQRLERRAAVSGSES